MIGWQLQFMQRAAAAPPAGAVIIDPSDDGIRAFAWATLGVDLNPDAALFKRGRELKLGYPRSQELLCCRLDV